MYYGELQTTLFNVERKKFQAAYFPKIYENADHTTLFLSPPIPLFYSIKGTTKVNSQFKSCLIVILNENMDVIAKTISDENGVYEAPSYATGNYIIAKPLSGQACPKISGMLDSNTKDVYWANLKEIAYDGDSNNLDMFFDMVIQNSSAVILSLNPDHYWKLDDPLNVTDEITSVAGTITGTLIQQNPLPIYNAATEYSLDFDQTDYVDLNQGAAYDEGTLSFTFESPLSYNQNITDTSSADPYFVVQIVNLKLSIYTGAGYGFTHPSFEPNKPYNITITKQAGSTECSLYINGEFIQTLNVNAQTIGIDLIGGYRGHSNDYLGKLDNVCLWNRILSDDEIRLLGSQGVIHRYRDAVLNKFNVKHYWTLDDPLYIDEYGTKILATVSGTISQVPALTTPIRTKSDENALQLSTDSIIKTNIDTSLDVSSLSILIETDSALSGRQVIIDSANGISVGLNGNQITLYLSSDNLSTITLSPSTVYHIVVTKNGDTFKLYVDGVLDSTFTITGGELIVGYIGVNSDETNDHFLGKIDEVGYFVGELTATEVANIYKATGL